jgi:hypothetical protein
VTAENVAAPLGKHELCIPERVRRMVDEFHAGRSIPDIAVDRGRTPFQIAVALSAAGVRLPAPYDREYVIQAAPHIVAAYLDTPSLHAVAGRFEVSHETVRRVLLAAGIPRRQRGRTLAARRSLPAPITARVTAAYRAGLSIRAVAAELRLPEHTVRMIVTDAGVLRRRQPHAADWLHAPAASRQSDRDAVPACGQHSGDAR